MDDTLTGRALKIANKKVAIMLEATKDAEKRGCPIRLESAVQSLEYIRQKRLKVLLRWQAQGNEIDWNSL